MFETEYIFEELPVLVGTTEIAMCSGRAYLEGDIAPHDYGYRVYSIVLDGNLDGQYREKRSVEICERSSDVFCAQLFRRLAERIESSTDAAEFFYDSARQAASIRA
ncbi:MAG: hypothetical protein AAF724_12990 [Pseudomonadota bacterium]